MGRIKYKRKKTNEGALFRYLWRTREHKSFLSGRGIKYFDYGLFAHIVAKSKSEILRLEKMNIFILTREEHALLDSGTEAQREAYAKEWNCDWNKLYEIKEKFMNEKRVVHTDRNVEIELTYELEQVMSGNINVTTYRIESGDEVDNKIDIVIWDEDFSDMLHNETFHTVEEVRNWYKGK